MNSQRSSMSTRVWATGLATLAGLAIATSIASCGGGNSTSSMTSTSMGTVNVSISDPPSCMPPDGPFTHVYNTLGQPLKALPATTSSVAEIDFSGCS